MQEEPDARAPDQRRCGEGHGRNHQRQARRRDKAEWQEQLAKLLHGPIFQPKKHFVFAMYRGLRQTGRCCQALAIPKSSPFRPVRFDLDIVGGRELALLLLGVLVGKVRVDLHHLQALMAQVALERK